MVRYSCRTMNLTDETVETLVAEATRARGNAYAPYSGFSVGAAALARDGRIFLGCNMENASYGLSVCAERHAIAAAAAAGVRELAALAVVTSARPPASPCGACRQVMAELGEFLVILADLDGNRVRTSVSELLPRPFLPDTLPR